MEIFLHSSAEQINIVAKARSQRSERLDICLKKNCHPVFLLTDQRRLNHANQKDKGNLREAVKNYLTDFFR